MKTIWKSILLLTCFYTAQGQIVVSGLVIDSDSQEPLPFVNIGIQNDNAGTVSDENGAFKLDIKSQNDILIFSYLGYESIELNPDTDQGTIEVALTPSAFDIDEVIISSSSFDKEVRLGSKNEKGRGRSIGFGNAQLGTELGALIKIDKETFIKSANFVLNHAKGDSLLLRLNIYNYSDGKIGEKLLHENIFVKEKQRKGLFSINLEPYEIILNNDVLLSLEWLKNYDERGNRGITFDTKKSRKYGGTFIRATKTRDFQKLPIKKKYKPCIFFIGKQSSK